MDERIIVSVWFVGIAVAGYFIGRRDINREFKEQIQSLADRERDINNALNTVVNAAAKMMPTAKAEKELIKQIEQETGQTFGRKIVKKVR